MSEETEKTPLSEIKAKKNSKTKPVLTFLLLFSLLVVLSVFSLQWYKLQAIKNVKISGNNILTNSEIYDLINDKIIGVATNGIDLLEVKKNLEAHPYIAKATVWFNSKGVLGIEINERHPSAVIVTENGNTDFVDNSGTIMPYRLNKEFTNLPVISNVFFGKKLNKTALTGALLIVAEMVASQAAFSQTISEIQYIPETKSYQLYLADSKLNVLFGRTDDIAEKLDKLYIFWKEKLLVSKFDKDVKELDIRWKDLVVVSYY